MSQLEAVRRVDAALARQYPTGDVPAYKSPTSPEYAHMIDFELQQLAIEERWADFVPPLPLADGFHPIDDEPAQLTTTPAKDGEPARTLVRTALGNVAADFRILARLLVDVENVGARHEQHRDCRHPHCIPCELRRRADLAGLDEVDDAGRELIELDVRRLVYGRTYRWLASGRAGALDVRPPAPVDTSTTPWATLDELAAVEPAPWLVDGLLPAAGLGYLIGRDGTGKTFAALDLALASLTGQPFHGRETSADGGVLFVAAEGAASFPARIAAWETHHRRALTSGERRALTIRTAAVNLFADGPDVAELIARCEAEAPSLVVFDTLRRCAGAADQNSAADMGVVTDVLERVKRASGGVVLVIAHTGKGDDDARGSSSIEDDADFVLHLKAKERTARLEVTKQKDGETGAVLALHPTRVAGSLVLADQPDPVMAVSWSSSDPRVRVTAALRELAPMGPATQSQVIAQAEGLAQSAASRALGELIEARQVRRIGTPGRGARYELATEALDGAVDEVP